MGSLKSFAKSSLAVLKKDFRIVFRRSSRALWRGRLFAIAFLLAILGISFFLIHPYDEAAIEHVEKTRTPEVIKVARTLGWWGDFAQYNLTGFLLLWGFGALTRKRWFQRLAVATFLAALFAGLTVNALRFTTGRARPYANVEDKFYGPTGVLKGWKYHGFPSGHTSTAMGMCSPVATAGGIYSLPVVLFSSSVAVSRVYRMKHYPTDVIVGGSFGIVYGFASGWHLRRVRLRLNNRNRRKPQKKLAKRPAPSRESETKVAGLVTERY